MENERWLLIAASSRGAAEDYAARRGISAALVLDRRELLVAPWRLRRRIAAAGVDRAAIHSLDWSRERAPQLAELALGIAPVRKRMLFDEATDARQPPPALALRVGLRLPVDLVIAAACGLAQAFRLKSRRTATPPAALETRRRVLAIWPGSSSDVGGAVTHISGILGGLRHAGVRVALASAFPPPPQLAAVVDEIEIAPGVAAASRITKETEQLAINRNLDLAARTLAARFRPDLIYQRHRAFLDTGARLSGEIGVPLLLEWNASEVWMRGNWDPPTLTWGQLERIVESTERRVVAGAALVVAVSENAAAMAIEMGAQPGRIAVVPNGVDIGQVDQALNEDRRGEAGASSLVGWIGSFGPWHGAQVLVRAMPHLPDGVQLRMIGDGAGRPDVERLAFELGVSGRIEWCGSLPHEVALQKLAECDILASPHVPAADRPFFGSPTKIFEYMALERPIVASRLEQIAEVLEPQRTALLVEPGDDVELAGAILELVERPELGAAMGRAAAAEAHQMHSWERRAKDLLAALERIA